MEPDTTFARFVRSQWGAATAVIIFLLIVANLLTAFIFSGHSSESASFRTRRNSDEVSR